MISHTILLSYQSLGFIKKAQCIADLKRPPYHMAHFDSTNYIINVSILRHKRHRPTSKANFFFPEDIPPKHKKVWGGEQMMMMNCIILHVSKLNSLSFLLMLKHVRLIVLKLISSKLQMELTQGHNFVLK